MKPWLFFLLFTSLTWSVQAQTISPDPTGSRSLSQNPKYAVLMRPGRYLALDANNMVRFRRYRFFEGDEIRFKSRVDGTKYEAPLYVVTDSTFSIIIPNEIMNRQEPLSFRLGDVQKVYIDRQIPWVTAGSFILPLAGVVFAIADYVNPKSLDGRSGRFIFDSRSLVPAGALIGAGAICYKLSFPRYRINKNNRLRVLRTL
ncbi:hypothetical protein GCM10023189_20950 [Nibrella saemangeumensis]|uniref:DUF4384 domain-containing protein n=1 Tax=Nibrella saemangeumensis TaxID=1084526 RepID=A0ABP8MUG9_9BACT